MQSNFQRTMMEQPKRGPRNRAEQRTIWRRKLQEDLELEKEIVELLEIDEFALKMELFYSGCMEQDSKDALKKALAGRAKGIGLIFLLMHRVAYFDGLLDGTGISKDATRRSLYCEDV